jgi:hypothetical protein
MVAGVSKKTGDSGKATYKSRHRPGRIPSQARRAERNGARRLPL